MSETILLGYGALPPVPGGSSVTLGSSGATVFMSGVSVAASGLTLQGGALTVCGTAGGIGQAFGAGGWAPAPAASPAPAAMAPPYAGFYVLTSSALALAPGAPGASVLVKNYTAAPATLTGSLVPPYLSVSAETLTLQAGGAARLVSDGGAWYAQAVTGAPPGVSAISPTTGPTSGETNVEITGSGLTGATQVRFGTLVSPSYTVSGDTLVTASAPFAGTSESLTVYVQTPVGVNATGPSYLYRNGPLPPTVTGIIPVSGPVTGSTNGLLAPTATVTGSGFIAASGGVGNSIMIGGNAATLYSLASSTATAISLGSIPAGVVGPASVAVTTSGGTSTVNDLYVYNPVLSTLTPSNGPLAGGGAYAVTLSGYGFASATSVYFGATPATGLTVNTDNSVTVFAPDRGAGSVNVVLAVSGYVSNPAVYDYVLAPVIQNVTPNMGPVMGATPITLSGQNFNTVYSVTFNGNSANFTVNSDNLITTTPPSFPTVVGTPIQVSVVSPGGHGDSTYTYLNAPNVQLVTPSEGPTAGNQLVNITGQYLSYASEVTIGGIAVSGSFTVVDDSLISATTPAGSAGLTSVVVTTPGGNGTNNGYTYVAPPTLSEISPAAGPLAGGQSVTICGTNLSTVTSLTIVDVAADFVPITDNIIVATTRSSAAGRGNVVVSNVGGSATLVDAYTYIGAPAIQAITPNMGPLISTSQITISGVNFTDVNVVTFESISADFTVVSDNTITTLPPTGPVGLATLYIASPGGNDSSGYTYLNAPGLPTVTPSAGPTGGNQSVSITGQYLSYATAVTFGGVPVSGPFTITDGTITATTPPGVAGLTAVSITTPGGEVTAANAYTYVVPPLISAVAPTAGPVAGSQTVTLTGAGFTGASLLTLAGAAATIYSVTDTSIVAVTTASGAGAGLVSLTTAGGVTTSGSYTYEPVPVVVSVTPNVGPVGGGNLVTISGTGFTVSSTVAFGAAVTSAATLSAGLLTLTAPTSSVSGPVDLVVTTQGGSSNAIAYYYGPTVTGIYPDAGPVIPVNSVTINGTGLDNVAAVTFGGISAEFVPVTPSYFVATPPVSNQVGPVTVEVTTTNGTSYSTYTYTPAVTALSPSVGPLTAGTAVAITGSGFVGATSVAFNTTPASYTVDSATAIRAVAPAAITAGDVTVYVTAGGQVNTSSPSYTYLNPPAVSTLSPSSGSALGGEYVTVGGSYFTGTTAVRFGSATASFSFVDDSSISAVAPAGSGSVAVTVTTSGGTSTGGPGYTYLAVPVINSFSPVSGPVTGTAGGSFNVIGTISGTGFASNGVNNIVTIGGAAATVYTTAGGDTSVYIPLQTIPPGAPGLANIVVSTINGSSEPFAGYTYNPVLSDISPSFGTTAGQNTVTISGTGFTGATSVLFGATTVSNITVVNNNRITVTAPAHAAGAADIVVTGSGYSSGTLPYTYYTPPTLGAIAPAIGPVAGGQQVSLSGSTLSDVSAVKFGTTSAAFTISSDSTIWATTPAGTGAVSVTATNSGGLSNALAYQYAPVPSLLSVAPSSGTYNGGLTVTLSGTGFTYATSVLMGGATASHTVNSDSLITVTTPAGAVGAAAVYVSGPGGSSAPVTYTYTTNPAVYGMTPASGPVAGGFTATITGLDFGTSGGSVTVNGMDAPLVSQSHTVSSLQVTVPAGTGGSANVVVTTIGGASPPYTGFGFNPTPGALVPNSGPLGVATRVTLTGSGLAGVTSVAFGGVAATDLTISGDTVVVSSPGLALGSYDVAVAANGYQGTNTLPFTYYFSLPVIDSITPASGPLTGGESITLVGQGFSGATGLTICGVAATNLVATAAQVSATTPAGSSLGPKSVVVTVPSGSSTGGPSYTYNPVITSLNPTYGSYTSNIPFNVYGVGFTASSVVTVSGVARTTNYVSSTQVNFTCASGTTATPVAVTTGSYKSAPIQLPYTNVPIVRDIIPRSDLPYATSSLDGGDSITIFGTNFLNATSVLFGSTPAASFNVVSTNVITAVVPPAAAPGFVSLNITTPIGTNIPNSKFAYAPTLYAVTPANGPFTGGSVVTLSGAGFTGATSVTFNTVSAAFTLVDSGTITAVTPPNIYTIRNPSTLIGAVGVIVTASGIPSGVDSAPNNLYTYTVPVVTSVSPSSGPISGDQYVTFTGAGFLSALGATTLRGAISVQSFEVVDDNTIVVLTAPQLALGAVSFIVDTAGYESAAYYGYTTVPSISTLANEQGPVIGGNVVYVYGSGLDASSTVRFGSVQATIIARTNAFIQLYAPSGNVGTVEVTLTTTGLTSAPSLYTYLPVIDSLSPSTVPLTGGVLVTASGAGFDTVYELNNSGDLLSFNKINDNTITFTSPVSSLIDVVSLIQVIATGGYASILTQSSQLLYTPYVSSIVPNQGPINTATPVVINGQGFVYDMYVVFGPNTQVLFTHSPDGLTLTGLTPSASQTGTFDVVVNPGNTQFTVQNGFTFY